MTKLAICSDLHLEFGPVELNNEGADVLILSGDIMVANDLDINSREDNFDVPAIYNSSNERARRYRQFLQHCSNQFPNVVYVAGNHEFYHGKWNHTIEVLRQEAKHYHNVNFLESDAVDIDGVTFIGGSLWTDCNKGDPLTLHGVRDMLNDFQLIKNEDTGSRLLPVDTIKRHEKTLGYFKHVLDNNKDGKFVVVGHHTPSAMSVHPRYKFDTIMNGAYHSDLSEFILDHPEIKLWTHGHTHEPFDYMIGDTRIVCNPRGYVGHDPKAGNFKLKYLEI